MIWGERGSWRGDRSRCCVRAGAKTFRSLVGLCTDGKKELQFKRKESSIFRQLAEIEEKLIFGAGDYLVIAPRGVPVSWPTRLTSREWGSVSKLEEFWMQSIHGGSFHQRVAQFPLNAVCWRAQWSTVVHPFTTSSVLPARIRPAGGSLLSSAGAPPPWFRFWLQDSSRRHRQAYSSFEHTLHILTSQLRDWKIVRTPAFQIFRLLQATMAPLSVAADEGSGRQLRRRKESHSSVSTTQVVASVRKKHTKAAVRSSPTDNDAETAQHREEPFATDLEARLWNLEKTDQLTSLTVVELRALMKQISRPTAGRKEELIGEVRKWLTDHQASANRQTVVDCTRPTRESSSDADSLEGTLLKVESKSREMVANSRMTESFAVADLREPLLGTKSVKKISETRTEEGYSPPNGNSGHGPKLSRGGRQRKPKPETDAEDDDELPEVEVPEKKSRASRNRKETRVEKLSENLEESVDEEGARTTTVAAKKRKGQVSKTSQSKKGKVIEEEKVEIVEAKVVVSNEPWTMLVHKKLQPEWIAYNPTTMRPEPPPCGTKTMKVMSWNVNGLRALMKGKDKKEQEALLLTNLAMKEDFDVLCLQETKLQEKDVEKISNSLLSDYADSIWSCSTTKLGYSGTAVLSRVKPLSVRKGMGIPDHDNEGRLITVEFDTFFLLVSYVPNSGERLQRLSYRTEEWDPALSRYIRELEKQKPVILTGDLNCADEEIDIFSPDANKKTAGFTAEERASFKANFLNEGMVDTFRRQHPNAVAYTYWGYRSVARPKNQGWRLDYFLVSESLADQIHDSYTCPDVPGSDHCPLGIILKL